MARKTVTSVTTGKKLRFDVDELIRALPTGKGAKVDNDEIVRLLRPINEHIRRNASKGQNMLRKGQKVCNWIHEQGYSNENVHQKLFYMTDEEFEEALKWRIKSGTRHHPFKPISGGETMLPKKSVRKDLSGKISPGTSVRKSISQYKNP